MRTTIAVAVILAATSAVPSFAAPVTSTELVTRDYDGELEARDFETAGFYAREFNGDLEARSKAGKVFGKIGKGLLGVVTHILRREDPVLARAIEENPILARAVEEHVEMYARGIENDEELFARDVNGELEARNAKKVLHTVGNVAGGIAKGLLHFLREDSPEMYARGIENDEELFARDMNGELEARNAKKVLHTVGNVAGGIAKGLLHFLREDSPEIYARSFEDEGIYARDYTGDLEARSKAGKIFGKIGKGLLGVATHILKREDPVLARALEENPILARAIEEDMDMYARSLENDEELFARGYDGELEARNAKKVLHTVGNVAGGIAKGLLHFLREDSAELYARDYSAELEARSKAGKIFGKIGKGLLGVVTHILKREDPLLARALEEEPELFLRGFEGDDVFARDLEARSKAGKVFGKIGKGILGVASHFLRSDEELMAREFDDDMLFARGMEIDELD